MEPLEMEFHLQLFCISLVSNLIDTKSHLISGNWWGIVCIRKFCIQQLSTTRWHCVIWLISKVQSSNPKAILPRYWIIIEEIRNYIFLSNFWLFAKNVPKNHERFWTILINWFAGLCRFFWRKKREYFRSSKTIVIS